MPGRRNASGALDPTAFEAINNVLRDGKGWREVPKRNYSPMESDEQKALFLWSAFMEKRHPELKLLFAIANGGHRHKAVAAKLKAEGVRPGVPDIFLPVARHDYHGLFIELKRKGGKPTEAQQEWIVALLGQGYAAMVCEGAGEAIERIRWYLGARIDGSEVL